MLVKFFSRPDAVGHLRGLAEEFGDSTNSVRLELQKLEEAGLLQSQSEGQKVVYRVNSANPFYSDLINLISKHLGFDHLLESLMKQVGDLEAAYVVGDYATGIDSGTIQLILVGSVNAEVVRDLVDRVERRINRKIEYTIQSTALIELPKNQLKLI